MVERRGFVVAAWESNRQLFFAGRLEDGRGFACVKARGEAALFVDAAKAEAAVSPIAGLGCRRDPEAWAAMDGSALVRFELELGELPKAERALLAAGIEVLRAERGRAEDCLERQGIRGGVLIRGEERQGRRVPAVFLEPELLPSEALPPLRWLAFDIETDREERVLAVSLVTADGSGMGKGEALFLGPDTGDPRIRSFGSEAELLSVLAARVADLDPDVITGWNIVDFDFRVLAARYAALRIPFLFGRSDEVAHLVEKGGRRTSISCPGRAVIDAMRLARASGERFEDMRLETVAQAILGEGKSVASTGEDKLAELEALRAGDPVAFCSYCIKDSELVLRILEKTGLSHLTQARAALTGLPLELAWTSIPAFERVYAAGLRSRRIVPPKREERAVSGAAGGTVLDPLAGLYEGVLVFDFRSLYPSLMRTFNIDPLAHARTLAADGRGDPIVAPNGAGFEREPGVLPGIIARYAAEREAALAAGDETAAYVYKILQNSFYGVLGAEGCLYARTELAGAVTSFGRKFLTAARDFFEGRGYRTLYGDTDSVFVESGLGAVADGAGLVKLESLGASLADDLNAELSLRIREDYGLESFLRIRCEKIYSRFFIPRLRIDPEAGERRGRAFLPGMAGAEQARGRAKGYAGLRIEADGSSRVEVKGMEAARSDWTPLARRFQVELLSLVFGKRDATSFPPGSPVAAGETRAAEEPARAALAIGCYLKDFAARLRRGEFDAELVYRKMLRRPPEEYSSSSPQVRAAILSGMAGRRGSVFYVMTKAGPEPPSRRSGSPPDYEHYVFHQLLPIARAVVEALPGDDGGGKPLDALSFLADRPQLELGF
jgi:DNA polymerase-2